MASWKEPLEFRRRFRKAIQASAGKSKFLPASYSHTSGDGLCFSIRQMLILFFSIRQMLILFFGFRVIFIVAYTQEPHSKYEGACIAPVAVCGRIGGRGACLEVRIHLEDQET